MFSEVVLLCIERFNKVLLYRKYLYTVSDF